MLGLVKRKGHSAFEVLRHHRPESRGVATSPASPPFRSGDLVIGFGIFLLIVAVLFPKLAVLWGIGILCIVIGVILYVAGSLGHAIGGRRHYY